MLAHGFNLHHELKSPEVLELDKVTPFLCKHRNPAFCLHRASTFFLFFLGKKPLQPQNNPQNPPSFLFHSCHPGKKPHLSFREMSMPCYMLLCNYRSKSIAAECHLLRAAEQHQKCEQCIFPY